MRIALFLSLLIGITLSLPSSDNYSPSTQTGQSFLEVGLDPVSNGAICNGPEDCHNNGFCDLTNMCRCAPGWGGLDCSIEFTCPNNCSGNGLCRAHTCFCYHGYTGRDCAIALFCPNSCNGNGVCDRGLCVCDVGFDGFDCSKPVGCAYQCIHGQCISQVCVCDEGYFGPDCSDIDYCLTNCSNHGQCQDKRCICDYGYTGVVCSTMILCPNACSHKGECVNGTCMCDLGYTGIDCSEDCCPDQNVQCSAGKMCSYPVCECKNDCNQNGICHRGHCICRQGYFSDDCGMMYCPYNCSSHGTCDNAIGECTCDSGWKGLDCASVECPNDCSGNGQCMLFGGTSRICLCTEGYNGFDCSQSVPCPSNCSGFGSCVRGKCVCQNGREGVDCSESVPPWIPCQNDCSGHGNCQNGLCLTCDDGWQGKFCEQQKVVQVKPDGTIKCPGTPECNSHGLCGPGGKCFCSSDYVGDSCAIRQCPDDCNGRGSCTGGVCMCNQPYHSGPLQSCEFIQCPNNCTSSSNGICQKNIGKCSCLPPWTSDDCSIQPCPGSPAQCSSQGTCDYTSGNCTCLPDYGGADCSIYLRCPNDCSGNGVCYRGVCYCYSNYTGDNCKTILRPPPPPGYDWSASLVAAQQLFATARTVPPPTGPVPAAFSIEDKQNLFKTVYGDNWLRYWNLVNQNSQTVYSFVKAVTDTPPGGVNSNDATTNAIVQAQQSIFQQIFGQYDWQSAWSSIMGSPSVQSQFQQLYTPVADGVPITDGTSARGPGLPPPPPIARDPSTGPSIAQSQNLFSSVFGEGDGLAMQMLIFGNKTNCDLFSKAFSSWLQDNINRDLQDRRDNWEDDMLQLMTDSIGPDGPNILRSIYSDPTRAALFRSAFAGYLQETPDTSSSSSSNSSVSRRRAAKQFASNLLQSNEHSGFKKENESRKNAVLSRLINPKVNNLAGKQNLGNHRAPPSVK